MLGLAAVSRFNVEGNTCGRALQELFKVSSSSCHALFNTKGPINLLPITPHHTFTENLLWKFVTLVSCGLSWDHVCTFRKLFTPSRVKDASSLNKMTPNSSDVLVSSGRNPYVEHRRLVPDDVPFDHDTDKSLPDLTFTTHAYVIC